MAAQITDISALPKQQIVQWSQGGALGNLVARVNVSPMDAWANVWNQLPFAGRGLKVHYTDEGRGVTLDMPSDINPDSYQLCSSLVNMKCATYAFAGRLQGPGKTTEIGDMYMVMNQTHIFTANVRDPKIRARTIDATNKLQGATNGTVSDRNGMYNALQTVGMDLKPISDAFQMQLNPVKKVSADMLRMAIALYRESEQIHERTKNISPVFWAISKDPVLTWSHRVGDAINDSTYQILSTWQACWITIASNFQDINSQSQDLLNRQSKLMNQVRDAHDGQEWPDEFQADLTIWLSDVVGLYNLVDMTLLNLYQFYVNDQGVRAPVQGILTQQIYTVTDYSIPSWAN